MKSLTIIGRRWFDRLNGNTYHSAAVLVDGSEVGPVTFTYGYDDGYLQSAAELLKALGVIPPHVHCGGGLSRHCREAEITYHTEVTDGLKRDLHR